MWHIKNGIDYYLCYFENKKSVNDLKIIQDLVKVEYYIVNPFDRRIMTTSTYYLKKENAEKNTYLLAHYITKSNFDYSVYQELIPSKETRDMFLNQRSIGYKETGIFITREEVMESTYAH
jgi:hypothetical protein